MKKGTSILKRITGTLALPLAMYLLMMFLCYANGKTYYGSLAMWKTLIVDIAVSVTCAMGIGLQFKCGRFDFSGGAIMLLSAIIAGNMVKDNGSNPVVFFVLCMVISIVLSLIVSLVYVYGRLPIVIATIGMALLYEAITCLIFNGGGINLVANMKLKVFSSYPLVILPLFGSVAIYTFFSYFTIVGKQSVLLANNQQAAVNIGVNEKKNVIISYLYSGIIFGFASVIYASTGLHKASFSSLSSAGELFTNILPVFIGLLVIGFCGDTLGTIVGSITLCLMSFGLKAVFDAELGGAITTVITGLFIIAVNVISAQGNLLVSRLRERRV
jgi:ribose transport system permease protein